MTTKSRVARTTNGVSVKMLLLRLVACVPLLCCSATSPTDPASGSLDASPHDAHAPTATEASARPDARPLADAGACLIARKGGLQHVDCMGIALTIAAAAACESGSCGLIVDLHGLSMNADVEDANTNLRALGNAAGYIVVQPDAPQTTSFGPTWFDSDDDAVWAAVTSVGSAFAVDPKRVHVTGFSQGGYLTWRLVCAHADAIASAAPGAAGKAGCPVGNFNGSCAFVGAGTPTSPIDLLLVAGTRDAIVPF